MIAAAHVTPPDADRRDFNELAINQQVPNQQAIALTGRDYVSYSALATYQQCPLRYFFRYVAGLPEETVSASLAFGGAIHAAVERHFAALLAGEPPPTLETLLEAYGAAWRAYDSQEVLFGRGDDQASLKDLAARMLRAFRASPFASPAGNILGIEEELRGALVPGLPDLLARLDLVVETPDALVITDLKTSRSRWSESQVEESAAQLLLYHDLAGQLVPGRTVRLQFAVLTKSKEPVLELHPVAAEPSQIARIHRTAERVWRAITAQNFYPSPSAMQCPTCPYRTPCQAWCG